MIFIVWSRFDGVSRFGNVLEDDEDILKGVGEGKSLIDPPHEQLMDSTIKSKENPKKKQTS